MKKNQNILANHPSPFPEVHPRCLSALPGNIEELIYIFKNQENQLESDLQNLFETKQ